MSNPNLPIIIGLWLDKTFDAANRKSRSPRSDTLELVPMVTCADGFKVSIQASSTHCCAPRANAPWYSQFELGFPSASDPLILPYAKESDDPTNTVYPYVPRSVVIDLIVSHGGLLYV